MPTTLLFPIGFTEKKKKKRPKNWKNGLASHSVKNTTFYPYSKGLYFQKIRENEDCIEKYVTFITHQLISRNFCKEIVTVTFVISTLCATYLLEKSTTVLQK